MGAAGSLCEPFGKGEGAFAPSPFTEAKGFALPPPPPCIKTPPLECKGVI